MTTTDLANLALADLGANLITSLDNQPLIQVSLTQSLAIALRAHDWNFAQQVVDLAVVSSPGGLPSGMTTAFALPGNYSRRTNLHVDGRPLEALEFKVLGRRIYTASDTLTLTYVRTDPPMQDWPADFAQAVSTLLASRLAGVLLKNAGMKRDLYNLYLTTELPEAKRNDVQESPGSLYVHERTPYATSPAIASRRTRSAPGAYGIEAPSA